MTSDMTPASVTVATRQLVVAAPGRGADLTVRVTAPAAGDNLPVVVFAHGYGASMDAYSPLSDFWASRGIVVVQPTHLDSLTLGLDAEDPRTPNIWRSRIEDLRYVLDALEKLQASTPGLTGRLDPTRVAIAGHSYGATSASALLGARVNPPAGDADEDFTDPRVRAGVLLCLAGLAGDELTPPARQMFAFMDPEFGHMSAPALLVAGAVDQSPLSTRGPDWWEDGYRHSARGKSLLTLRGAEHHLGGIDQYPLFPPSAVALPAAVALVQKLSTAYLLTALGAADDAWPSAQQALAESPSPAGWLQSR